jgi:hypothetical protein
MRNGGDGEGTNCYGGRFERFRTFQNRLVNKKGKKLQDELRLSRLL